MTDEFDDRDNIAADALPKRRRGRPRKSDALTPAQRSAAYRARRQTAAKSVTVTQIQPAATDAYDALVMACDTLREDLAYVRAERDAVVANLAQAHQSRDEALKLATARPSATAAPMPAAAQVLDEPVPPDDGNGEKRLAVDVFFREFRSLERLAAHFGLSRRAVLERLIAWAGRDVMRTFEDDDVGFNRYLTGADRPRRAAGGPTP